MNYTLLENENPHALQKKKRKACGTRQKPAPPARIINRLRPKLTLRFHDRRILAPSNDHSAARVFLPASRYTCVKMFDQKKWSIAYIKFKAYYGNVPPWIKTPEVAHYHELVSALEEASGEDLSHFKIPSDRVKPKVIGAQRGSYRGGPGRTMYSSESYCENEFFQSQLDGLNEYLKTLVPKNPQPHSRYEELSDYHLEELMVSRKIKPEMVVENGRPLFKTPSREYIIAALLRQDGGRDHQQRPPVNQTNFYISGSQVNYESPGATITGNLGGFSKEEFANIVDGLRQLLAEQKLDPEVHNDLSVNIGTIELQLNSSKPNTSIIREALKSTRNIAEGAVGSLIASGLLPTINLLISKL